VRKLPSAHGSGGAVDGELRRHWPLARPYRVRRRANLEIRNAYTTGNHASSNCAFLSCARAKRTEGSDYQLGTTVDQLAARAIGGDTAIPSLEIGTDLIAQVGNCDNGYACAYQNNLSWSSATTPLPTETEPTRC
jgi:hypothetical protein